MRYHNGKLNILTSNYQFHPMTLYQLIVNWLLSSVSDNVTPLWTLGSKEVKHIKNGVRVCNMMKCFNYEVKIVAIDKVRWKAKMKDWDYISVINAWVVV